MEFSIVCLKAKQGLAIVSACRLQLRS